MPYPQTSEERVYGLPGHRLIEGGGMAAARNFRKPQITFLQAHLCDTFPGQYIGTLSANHQHRNRVHLIEHLPQIVRHCPGIGRGHVPFYLRRRIALEYLAMVTAMQVTPALYLRDRWLACRAAPPARYA